MSDEPQPVDQFYTTIHSPVGELLATSDGEALTGLYPPAHKDRPDVTQLGRDDAFFAGVRDQLEAYFRAKLVDFDIPLRPKGTPFQQLVWDAVTAIPCGVTKTYGELAEELKTASAAIGAAVARNPIAFVIPCHRVLGAAGALGGHAGGSDLKKWLLEHEGKVRLGAAYFEKAFSRSSPSGLTRVDTTWPSSAAASWTR